MIYPMLIFPQLNTVEKPEASQVFLLTFIELDAASCILKLV